jgi:N-acetylmuramoyl-L-alanine amidase
MHVHLARYWRAILHREPGGSRIVYRSLTAIALMTLAHPSWGQQPSDPVTCLANNIYYEAATESYAGKVAVGQVTLNRIADHSNDVCGVVYFKQVNPATGKKEAAFSWTLGRRWRARGRVDGFIYAECVWIAEQMLDGELKSHLIGPEVKSYHATYVHPAWHKPFAAQIGKHLFYRG